MGAVYEVEQLSTSARRALKVMRRELVSDPTSLRRFVREAQVASLIKSEHVVQVIGAGVDGATAMPWIAMEYLEGSDLGAHVLSHGPLEPEQVRSIFEQMCHALGAAHGAGIVHRDLKPENVFLGVSRRVGTPFTVKLLDFGIAKVVADAGGSMTAATGQVVGTPLWMAPEQATSAIAVGPACDVWALGLLAFFLLTGRTFWIAGTRVDATAPMLAREIMLDAIPPASERAKLLGFGGTLSPEFDAWLARCLQRDPPQRFADAAETYAALARALKGIPPSVAALGNARTEPPVIVPSSFPRQNFQLPGPPKIPRDAPAPMSPPGGTLQSATPFEMTTVPRIPVVAIEDPPRTQPSPTEPPVAAPSSRLRLWGVLAAAIVLLAGAIALASRGH
jgi:serine/threonine protein kinase